VERPLGYGNMWRMVAIVWRAGIEV